MSRFKAFRPVWIYKYWLLKSIIRVCLDEVNRLESVTNIHFDDHRIDVFGDIKVMLDYYKRSNGI